MLRLQWDFIRFQLDVTCSARRFGDDLSLLALSNCLMKELRGI